jgi:hypothetical protein
MVHEQVHRLVPRRRNAFMGVLFLVAALFPMPCSSIAAAQRASFRTACTLQPIPRRMRIRCLWRSPNRADCRGAAMAWGKSRDTSVVQPTPLPFASGTLTLDGVPLQGGTIEFHSDTQSKIEIRWGEIRDGRWSIPNLPPGQYRIEIPSVPDPAKSDPAEDLP